MYKNNKKVLLKKNLAGYSLFRFIICLAISSILITSSFHLYSVVFTRVVAIKNKQNILIKNWKMIYTINKDINNTIEHSKELKESSEKNINILKKNNFYFQSKNPQSDILVLHESGKSILAVDKKLLKRIKKNKNNKYLLKKDFNYFPVFYYLGYSKKSKESSTKDLALYRWDFISRPEEITDNLQLFIAARNTNSALFISLQHLTPYESFKKIEFQREFLHV